MPSFKSILAASAVAMSTATAHMILNTPPPYGSPNSSPLEASGSDYPCKATSNAGAPVTDMPIGSTQKLSFNGSAVHGGGSCQVALTTDSPATKQSKWMVIHSIIGGCPKKDAEGNLPEPQGDPSKTTGLADTYDYKIPEGVKPGTYTLAWTWFNKIGNREMYMNCASVKVSGGSSKRDELYANETFGIPDLKERDTSFPELFVANIPTSSCQTKEGGSVSFPQPGSSVDKFGSGQTMPPEGPNCGSGAAGSGSSSGTSGASQSGSASGSTPSGSTQGSASASTGGVDVESSPSAAASGSSNPAASGSSNPAPSAGVPSSDGSAASSPSIGGSASSNAASPQGNTGASNVAAPAPQTGGTNCGSPGQSICSPDNKQIGTCDQAGKVVFLPVPSGTECRNGMIAWPQGSPQGAGQKRSSRLQRRHYYGIDA